MVRPLSTILTLASVLLLGACGDDSDNLNQNAPTPISVTETFSGTLNPNGGATSTFVVQQIGNVTATLTTLSPEGTIIGLSLGTWNGQACQVILANDNAAQGNSVIGAATSPGTFCARVYDVGKLISLADYEISVTHF